MEVTSFDIIDLKENVMFVFKGTNYLKMNFIISPKEMINMLFGEESKYEFVFESLVESYDFVVDGIHVWSMDIDTYENIMKKLKYEILPKFMYIKLLDFGEDENTGLHLFMFKAFLSGFDTNLPHGIYTISKRKIPFLSYITFRDSLKYTNVCQQITAGRSLAISNGNAVFADIKIGEFKDEYKEWFIDPFKMTSSLQDANFSENKFREFFAEEDTFVN